MLSLSLTGLRFKPPIESFKDLKIEIELADGTKKSTEHFTYIPKYNLASIGQTVMFDIQDVEKTTYFNLEVFEYAHGPASEAKSIAKENITINKLYTSKCPSVTMSTADGPVISVDLNIEMSNEFSNILVENGEKTSRLKKIFNFDKFQSLKLNTMYHDFIFSLSAVIKAKDKVHDFFTWKNPHETLLISLAFSLAVLSSRMMIGIVFGYTRFLIALALATFLVFSNQIIQFILHPPAKANKSSPVREKTKDKDSEEYQRNLQFFKEQSHNVLFIVEFMKGITSKKDKTTLLKILLGIKKYAPLAILLLVIFPIRYLAVIGHWMVLLYHTQFGRDKIHIIHEAFSDASDRFEKISLPWNKKEDLTLTPKLSYAESKGPDAPSEEGRPSLDHIVDSTTASSSEQSSRVLKERIYITYENQRWWPGKNWRPHLLKGERPLWSDEFGEIEVKKEDCQLPNSSWHWEGDWTYIISPRTDSEGWEYASRFSKFDDPQRKKSLLHSVRRRKWIRKCTGFAE